MLEGQTKQAKREEGTCTILNKKTSHVILFLHQSQIESSTITHFIINVIKTPGKQNRNTRLDFGIFLADSKLGQCSHGSSANNGILQDHSVVNIANVLCRMTSLWTLDAEKMQYSDREFGEFAVFDKLTEVRKS